MEDRPLRERAAQVARLGRQMTSEVDRLRLLKMADDLYAQADREEPERGGEAGTPSRPE
jgi:hypothetical protein